MDIDCNSLANPSCSLNACCLTYNCQSGWQSPSWTFPQAEKERKRESHTLIIEGIQLWQYMQFIFSTWNETIHLYEGDPRQKSTSRMLMEKLVVVFAVLLQVNFFYSLHWLRYLWQVRGNAIVLHANWWLIYHHQLPPFSKYAIDGSHYRRLEDRVGNSSSLKAFFKIKVRTHPFKEQPWI